MDTPETTEVMQRASRVAYKHIKNLVINEMGFDPARVQALVEEHIKVVVLKWLNATVFSSKWFEVLLRSAIQEAARNRFERYNITVDTTVQIHEAKP